MKLLLAVILLLASIQAISTSAISKFATGSASTSWAALGSLSAQIAAVGDPQPSSMFFNSGAYPPQYLELELPSLYTVHNIFLQVEQIPYGNSTHKLYAGSTSNPTQLVTTLDGYTTHGQWIHINYSPPLTNVRFLRIHTISSTSWVAWRKFLVI